MWTPRLAGKPRNYDLLGQHRSRFTLQGTAPALTREASACHHDITQVQLDSALCKPRGNSSWRNYQFDTKALPVPVLCQQCRYQNTIWSCLACIGRACRKGGDKAMEGKTLKRWSCQESNCPLVKNKKKKTLIGMSAYTSAYESEGRHKIPTNLSFFFNIWKMLLRIGYGISISEMF